MPDTQPDKPRSPRKSVWDCVGVSVGVLFLCFLGYLYRDRLLSGMNDFVPLYVGGSLSGTSGLYDYAANERAQFALLGRGVELYFSRPAYYAIVLRIFSLLPYPVAYWIFQTLSLAAFGAFLWIWAKRHSEL